MKNTFDWSISHLDMAEEKLSNFKTCQHFINKNFSDQKVPDPDNFKGKSYQTFNEEMTLISYNLL
jgi:hypothetical protein